ncbi:hypothetical protein HF638_03235 [Paenibacillus sp. SZ31]|uniref:hypothetical protein n=1 Tax=Paenibacillus sp. SZ31 TaxID=2725555 RepID=UPI00146E8BCF|nr:hypothetical protein [Paenibacillus sp. SZ31]NMI02971.1 hypothetical protein [Paenibacillus sp. SZ31]
MRDRQVATTKGLIAMLAVLMAAIYLFPIFTLASFYAMEHLPYTLFILVVLAGWLGQFIQHKIPGFSEKSTFIRGVTALVIGLLFGLVVGMSLILPLPNIITLVLCGVISAYAGLTFEPAFHSVLLWRLQIVGVISAIVLTVASNRLEFMQPIQAYTMWIYIAGVISFAFWLVGRYILQLDRAILNDGKRKLVLRDFARANHQRFMWMFIVIVAIGAFPSLAAWLRPLRDRLLAWIRGWFGPISGEEPPLPMDAPNQPLNIPREWRESPSEPSILWNILGWVVMCALAGAILWLLLRFGQKTINRFLDRFKGMLQPGVKKAEPRTEYMDVSETLEAPEKVRKTWFRKKEVPPVQDAERVRYYYRTWIDKAAHRGVGIQGTHTPLEAAQTIIQNGVKQEEDELSARLPDTYNSVRYGGKVPDHSDMVEIDRIWKSYRSK